MDKSKLYCYVDESGQDTQGHLFVVSVVIPQNRDELLTYVEELEVKSGKGKFKWGRADPEKRLQYLTELLIQSKYPLKIYFSKYKQTKDYRALTVLTIAKAIRSVKHFHQHKFVILVDALNEKDQRFYGSQLHELGIPSKKVKGIKRDESNALIRLADSICGFLRDVVEGNDVRLIELYYKAIKSNILIEV